MAPEQARGEAFDQRVDIHALGVSLFESIAGRRPYSAQSYERLIETTGRSAVPDVRTIRYDTPALLADITMRAMALAPAHRFGSAREMQSALMLLTTSGSFRAHTDERDPDAPGSGQPSPMSAPTRVGHESITRVAVPLGPDDITRRFSR
jgi:serine/threonine-protein kinase